MIPSSGQIDLYQLYEEYYQKPSKIPSSNFELLNISDLYNISGPPFDMGKFHNKEVEIPYFYAWTDPLGGNLYDGSSNALGDETHPSYVYISTYRYASSSSPSNYSWDLSINIFQNVNMTGCGADDSADNTIEIYYRDASSSSWSSFGVLYTLNGVYGEVHTSSNDLSLPFNSSHRQYRIKITYSYEVANSISMTISSKITLLGGKSIFSNAIIPPIFTPSKYFLYKCYHDIDNLRYGRWDINIINY